MRGVRDVRKEADKVESFLGKNSNFRGELNSPFSSNCLRKIIDKCMGMLSFLKVRLGEMEN